VRDEVTKTSRVLAWYSSMLFSNGNGALAYLLRDTALLLDQIDDELFHAEVWGLLDGGVPE